MAEKSALGGPIQELQMTWRESTAQLSRTASWPYPKTFPLAIF